MTFITFLYVFDFNIVKSISFSYTAFIVAVLLVFYCFINSNYNVIVSKMLASKLNKTIVGFMCFFCAYGTLVTVVCGQFDFSYIAALLHQFVCLEIGVLLIALFKYTNVSICKTLINCFFIQSVIQVFSFLSPTFLKLTDYFRTDSLIQQRIASYDGFRGLAIAGSNFFGLAVAYALLFIMLAFYWDKWKATIVKKFIFSAFLIFGAFSAGRTAILGIAFWGIYLIVKVLRQFDKKTLRNIVVGIVLVVVFVTLIKNKLVNNSAWTHFTDYLFQVFGNESTGKGFSISNSESLNQLLNDYYFKVDISTLLFGDGRYTGLDGLYYMHTDAGYMRNILYWGIFATATLFLYEYKILMNNVHNILQKRFAWVMLIALAIFEYKGQTVGFLIISQALVILICAGMGEITNKEITL